MIIKKSFSMLTAMAIALTANCFSANVFSASVSDPNCTSVKAGDDSTFIGKWEYYKHRTEAQEFLLKDEHFNPYIYEINAGGTGFQYEYRDNGIINEDNLIQTLPIEWSSSGNTLNVTIRYQVNLTEYETQTYTYTLINNELVHSDVYHNTNHTEFWRRYNSDPPQTETTTTITMTTTTTTSTTTSKTTTTKSTEKIIYGDTNCDGTLDMSDAVLIMQSLANPSKYKLTEQGRKNADFDGDGVTNGDALTIQKKLLKLD